MISIRTFHRERSSPGNFVRRRSSSASGVNRSMLRKTVNWIVLAVAIFLGMQLTVRLPGNPPTDGTIDAPPEVQATLRRACFDCHSNETRWPWYSRVAPGAWLAAHDVTLGRKEINFSEWGVYLPATRVRKLEWMGRALDQEVMPPKTYR